MDAAVFMIQCSWQRLKVTSSKHKVAIQYWNLVYKAILELKGNHESGNNKPTLLWACVLTHDPSFNDFVNPRFKKLFVKYNFNASG